MKEEFKFIILGSDDNAYGMSRSIYEKYHVKPLLLCNKQLYPTEYSKIVEIEKFENFDKEELCIENIKKVGNRLKESYNKLILIPCSDWYMEICIKHKKELELIFENRWNDYSLLQSFITKDKFYELCEKYNLKYPKTIIVKLNERKEAHTKVKFKYPIILKPNNSNSSEYLHASFEGKKKVFIINSEEELKRTISNIDKSSYKDNLIIQEFVEGDDTNNVVINCYSDKNGKVVAMALGRAVLEEYLPSVMGNYAAIISEPGYNDLFKSISSFLENIKYKGFSNFDLKYDINKKEYFVFEINYRQGRSSFFVNESGINLAELLVDDLIYNKKNDKIKYPTEKILWLNIPEYVAKKYIKNKKVNKEVRDLIKKKKVVHTLKYKKDTNIKRSLKIGRMYLSKIKQYMDYFVEK